MTSFTPVAVDPRITTCPTGNLPYNCTAQLAIWNNPSLAWAPQTSTSLDRVVVFLPGTGSTPNDYEKSYLTSLALYGEAHVLGLSYLSYPYGTLTLSQLCGTPVDNGGLNVSQCLENTFNAATFGEQSCSFFGSFPQTVSSRLLSTLNSLHNDSPDDGWDSFFTGSSINWSKITISGFSQGASQATYLAYKMKMASGMILSGPQECCALDMYFTNTNLWQTPRVNMSFFYNFNEDERGPMTKNIAFITNSTLPVKLFDSSQSATYVPVDKYPDGKVFYSDNNDYQVNCPCKTRPQHCSMAFDTCTPLSIATTTGYLYQYVWQYLAFNDYKAEYPANNSSSNDDVLWPVLFIILLLFFSSLIVFVEKIQHFLASCRRR